MDKNSSCVKEICQEVRELSTKGEDLSLILGFTRWKERTGSLKLSSDHYIVHVYEKET